MRLQIKAPAPDQPTRPIEGAARAALGRRLRGPAAPPRPARRRGRRCAGCSGRSPLRPGPNRRSAPAERSTPPIPLTLRAMNRISHHHRSSARPAFALLSVLALLALACFPVLAQADSSGSQYEPEVADGYRLTPRLPRTRAAALRLTPLRTAPRPTTRTLPGLNLRRAVHRRPIQARAAAAAPARVAQATARPASSSRSRGRAPTAPSRLSRPATQTTSDDSSSSPLVPILIAIAALAAISIGAVVIRQRRQRRSPGGQVSPKAS